HTHIFGQQGGVLVTLPMFDERFQNETQIADRDILGNEPPQHLGGFLQRDDFLCLFDEVRIARLDAGKQLARFLYADEVARILAERGCEPPGYGFHRLESREPGLLQRSGVGLVDPQRLLQTVNAWGLLTRYAEKIEMRAIPDEQYLAGGSIGLEDRRVFQVD